MTKEVKIDPGVLQSQPHPLSVIISHNPDQRARGLYSVGFNESVRHQCKMCEKTFKISQVPALRLMESRL